jgi:hypothetical protein
MSSRVFQSSIKVSLEVDGKEVPELNRIRIPVTRTSMRYAANAVPEASFSMPVGFTVSGQKLSPAHVLMAKARSGVPITAYIQGFGEMYYDKRFRNHVRRWPNKEQVLWKGRVTGVSHRRTDRGYSFVINSAHWLHQVDLGSVALKNFMRPGASVDLFNDLATIFGSNTGGSTIDAFATSLAAGLPQDQLDKIDLWNMLILPALLQLMLTDKETATLADKTTKVTGLLSSNTSSTLYEELLELTGNLTGREGDARVIVRSPLAKKYDFLTHPGNKPAALALAESVNGEKQDTHLDDKDNVNLRPFVGNVWSSSVKACQIDLGTNAVVGGPNTLAGGPVDFIARAVANVLMSGADLGSASAWNKLLVLAQSFQLNVIPTALSGTVVPRTPVAPAANIWRELNPSDFISLSSQSVFPRTLAGVVLLRSEQMGTLAPGDAGGDIQTNINGAYIGLGEGHIDVINAPSWLNTDALVTDWSDELDSKKKAKDRRPPGLAEISRDLGIQYARAAWADQHYGLRGMRLSTPLRFDLAPNSLVKLNGLSINTLATGTVGVVSDKTGSVFGQIADVAFVIDADTKSAGMELTVTHIRSPKDEEQQLIPDRHPVYGVVWPGSALLTWDELDKRPTNKRE